MLLQTYIGKFQLYYNRATKWRVKEQARFIQRLSVLMQEGYLFPQAMSMLLPHHIEDHEIIQQQINEKLRQGEGVTSILETLHLAKHHLVAIKVAENNGRMLDVLKGVAKQMIVSEQTKKKLIKLLIYPVMLISFLLILFFIFRTIFLPNIEKMVSSRSIEGEKSSLALSKILLHVPDYVMLTSSIVIVSLLIVHFFLKRQPIPLQLSIRLKIPLYQFYIRLSWTRQFAAYLGSLLQSGFSLQASLQILEEQSFQPFLQYLSRQIKERVIFGESLTQAVQIVSIFHRDFATFVEHGEQSGYLGKELTLYSELLMEKQELLLHKLLAFIQPSFFIVIAICILAAYVSLLLPIYHMIDLV
ncbi:competence type IV pilus assembly protein ComGB [Lysinibacillus sp. VIII_CA]|uniref:competence type IV pilus assembly protein ComGB n=1 Tax=Lysinibacillus TaxID=400634 RepID=UPI0018CDFDC0|nr:competence type IV pilus assembly protein ComGB [Lysinibacillus sphaericus]MBG9756709.1 chromosome partitioning protein ParA [Lysinibacillus sphaericus]MEB7453682.1 type II secretion system F family protein [Lysinibacillus sphaericus]QTB12248.1 type II secretion system F family protein [Lysinibacillus sphaericus]